MASNPFLEDLPLLTPQQRREVRAAFQVALVESPLPTVLTDLEGRILGTNTLVEELLGLDETALLGRLILDLVPEEDRPLTAAVIQRLAVGQTRREDYETRLVRGDGGLVWIRRHVLRVDGPDGDAQSYLVALYEDVTRARIAERESVGLMEMGKRIAAGAPLANIAARLADLAEQRWNRVGCMLNISDAGSKSVHAVSHSRLPDGMAEAFACIPVSKVGIPCGMAAAYGHPVAVRDVMTDPRTADMRELLGRFDIVSGWSVPLHDVEGTLLGTLGLFHPYSREPDDGDWQALGAYADVAAIAIMVDRRHASSPAADEPSSPAARGPRGAERLSEREQAVVNRLLKGDRVPAIARAMYLSQGTVRNHLWGAFRKLRVNSQQELLDLYKRSAEQQ